jgi:hypothetical protein
LVLLEIREFREIREPKVTWDLMDRKVFLVLKDYLALLLQRAIKGRKVLKVPLVLLEVLDPLVTKVRKAVWVFQVLRVFWDRMDRKVFQVLRV